MAVLFAPEAPQPVRGNGQCGARAGIAIDGSERRLRVEGGPGNRVSSVRLSRLAAHRRALHQSENLTELVAEKELGELSFQEDRRGTTGAAGMVRTLRNVGAGLVASLLLLASAFSNGALIFTGPLQPFLGQGVAAAQITTAVTTIFVALTSSFPSAIAGPVGNMAALLAAMMVTLAPVLSGLPPDQALGLAVAGLGGAALLTGLALFALGWKRLGKLIRFVPYPVVAGFLAATGWLIVSGAIRMATGVPISRATLLSFAAPPTALQ